MPALRLPYLVLAAITLLAVVMAGAAFALTQPRADPTPDIAVGPGSGPASQATPGPGGGEATPDASGGQATPPAGATVPPATPIPTGKDPTAVSASPEELEGYVWPLQHANITSRMAPRDEAGFVIIDGEPYHDGLDLATRCGDEVLAAHDGVVLYAGLNFDPYIGYWGDPAPIYARLERLGRVNDQPIVVVIDDGNGYRSIYVHLREAKVEAGMTVRAGDIIGLEGATGYATGCHLHYGLIRMDGGWQQVLPELAKFGYPPYVRERVDPLKVLDWGDEYAPQRLRDKVNGTPSPLPVTPSPGPTATPVPTATATLDLTASPPIN